MNGLQFGAPSWLIIGGLVSTFLFLALRLAQVRRQQRLARFAAPAMLAHLVQGVSRRQRLLKDWLVAAGVACCFLALARPQYGSHWEEVRQRGIDILMAVDVSRSMLARDIQPNRLERAKLAIHDFVDQLQGDRVGLLPFAGTGYLMCPLTSDYQAFRQSLEALDVTLIPRGGTRISAAIDKAVGILTNEANHRILILVTDGEDLGGDALEAARQAAAQKVTIFCVGVGTPQGELIPDPDKPGGFVRDRQGKFVTSRLDSRMLQEIARITHGVYVPLGATGEGFAALYRQKLALVPKEEFKQRRRQVPNERFAYPLAAALILLGLEYLLSGPFRSGSGKTKGHLAVLLVGAFLGMGLARTGAGAPAAGRHAVASSAVQGQADEELKKYQALAASRPHQPQLQYNLGYLQYAKGHYREAAASFARALATEDLDLQEKSYYNLGNSLFLLGKESIKTDPRHTRELWQQSLAAFEAALQLDSKDADAAGNRALVKKWLKKLPPPQESQGKEQKNKKKKTQKDPGSSKKRSGRNKSKSQGLDRQQQQAGKSKESRKERQPQRSRQERAGSQVSRQGFRQQGKPAPDRPEGAGKIQPRSRQKGQAARMARQQAGERRRQGKMTRAEACRLLDGLRGEEGNLHFVPQEDPSQEAVGRNW